MKHNYKAILLLLAFTFCHLFMRQLWGESWSETLLELDGQSYLLLSLASWTFIYSPFLICALVIFNDQHWADIFGVKVEGSYKYLLAATLCCLPMFIGYSSLSEDLNLSLADVITGSVYPAFFEEIIFRAVLFGMLYRFCHWGFIKAALTSSLIFGIGHLYQSSDFGSALLLFGFMAVAGSWFAWLFCECENKIWFPMWMHLLMNAAYGVFNMSGGAIGELDSNLYKGSAIILSIVYVQWQIKKGKPREVNLNNLWSKKPLFN